MVEDCVRSSELLPIRQASSFPYPAILAKWGQASTRDLGSALDGLPGSHQAR